MADHAQLRGALWAALSQEPRPLTLERVRGVAQSVLPPRERAEFGTWLEKHGNALLEKLNV